MKPRAFLDGRGALTGALVAALRSGRVASAALDVEEPPSPSNPVRDADNLGPTTLQHAGSLAAHALGGDRKSRPRPRGSLRVRRVVVTGACGGTGRAAAAAQRG